ncbi:MAG TPA: catalase family peroxidase [Polyangiaceae bacterium]|nr:catalase family peroxidase [Polyangiaceae bacterium]
MALSFLYVGGWFSPHALTPSRFVDTFEQVNGMHPGFRRNHAKGVGVSGTFESNGQGASLSKAVVFERGRIPVIGRFALAGGMPYAADAVKAVRSLALEFRLPDGEEWRTGMNAIPVFAVRTPDAFRDQLVAMAQAPGKNGPDPSKVSAFLARYPETARAIGKIKAYPSAPGFAQSRYNSLNAFVLVASDGRRTPVRWSMVPEPEAASSALPSSSSETGANFLFDALAARIHRAPPKWHLVLTLGAPNDPTSDATVEWPAERRTVDVGTLTLDDVESEETSSARTVNFDPLVLPAGIEGSDDPLLSARSAAYSVSFRRRVAEPAASSAVTPADVQGRGAP